MARSFDCELAESLQARWKWLADYLVGSLALEEERHVESHLRRCRACDAALDVIQHELSRVEQAVHSGAAIMS